MEFVVDLHPDANILPRDPILRAKARFFIDAVSTKYIPAAYIAYIINGEEGAREKLFKATEDIQALLPSEGYAIGEWSIADAAITPFLARIVVSLENDIGRYPEGEGPATLNDLRQSQKFKRFNKYLQDVTCRQSFTKTFDKASECGKIAFIYVPDVLDFRNTTGKYWHTHSLATQRQPKQLTAGRLAPNPR